MAHKGIKGGLKNGRHYKPGKSKKSTYALGGKAYGMSFKKAQSGFGDAPTIGLSKSEEATQYNIDPTTATQTPEGTQYISKAQHETPWAQHSVATNPATGESWAMYDKPGEKRQSVPLEWVEGEGVKYSKWQELPGIGKRASLVDKPGEGRIVRAKDIDPEMLSTIKRLNIEREGKGEEPFGQYLPEKDVWEWKYKTEEGAPPMSVSKESEAGMAFGGKRMKSSKKGTYTHGGQRSTHSGGNYGQLD